MRAYTSDVNDDSVTETLLVMSASLPIYLGLCTLIQKWIEHCENTLISVYSKLLFW